jgi:hypothetical protein
MLNVNNVLLRIWQNYLNLYKIAKDSQQNCWLRNRNLEEANRYQFLSEQYLLASCISGFDRENFRRLLAIR